MQGCSLGTHGKRFTAASLSRLRLAVDRLLGARLLRICGQSQRPIVCDDRVKSGHISIDSATHRIRKMAIIICTDMPLRDYEKQAVFLPNF